MGTLGQIQDLLAKMRARIKLSQTEIGSPGKGTDLTDNSQILGI